MPREEISDRAMTSVQNRDRAALAVFHSEPHCDEQCYAARTHVSRAGPHPATERSRDLVGACLACERNLSFGPPIRAWNRPQTSYPVISLEMARIASNSTPISVVSVVISTSKHGCRPPPHGNRTILSSSRSRAGHRQSAVSGSGGSLPGWSRKNPNAFATSAAEDSGLANLPLAISLPGAAPYNARMRAIGTPGNRLS